MTFIVSTITAFLVVLLLHFSAPISSLNGDGLLLLSFKRSVLSDPLSVLENWNYNDNTPCSWRGVQCAPPHHHDDDNDSRVVSLILPNRQLLGTIPFELGLIEHLEIVDLSSNFLNGSLPETLFFNATLLKSINLSNNVLSGKLPSFYGTSLKSLELLNLSVNALSGPIPVNFSSFSSLRVVSLSSNYFSGSVPGGFSSVQFLDLSSNLLNGSITFDFEGKSLGYLNVSNNRISGEIPPEFASKIAANATIDLSFNNLTGQVPESQALKAELLTGNPHLCGKVFKNPCLIPSTLSNPTTNVSTNTSSPAIAVMPKPIDFSPSTGSPPKQSTSSKLRPEAIVGIVIGDLVGIGILSIIFAYIYQSKKKKRKVSSTSTGSDDKKEATATATKTEHSVFKNRATTLLPFTFPCFKIPIPSKQSNDEKEEEEEESDTASSDSDQEHNQQFHQQEVQNSSNANKGGTLVTVDGETELELETLLKASAYILGAAGSTIVYKAVLEDGTALAVRRIGDSGVDRARDFATHIRHVAKLRHPNLVGIRGYYWAADEKLVIYDYVPNGSLANAIYKRPGSSPYGPCPYQLPWEARLRIARGVARGLAYIHERKHVHGNLKPSNILLGADMEPRISDFGLERLVFGEASCKVGGGSARHFGSKRSTVSRESLQETAAVGASPSCLSGATPYHAPESLRSLKPSAKWDVYSFGIVLLELLTGKVLTERELGVWSGGVVVEERCRILRMADVAVRADVEVKGKEEGLVTWFKLGISCAAAVPQKRPSMKEALQVLERISS
ncbi:hypothetical protein Sjap_022815 [Stephania japonica]|uniref:Protein kinase domain-containing protein n=1 Tax=Stephania japonica TaxID=461633 RepID=A0AAP0HQ81_9MAGN